jgi:L-asparaginase II
MGHGNTHEGKVEGHAAHVVHIVTDPVLVEVMRGDIVESVHRGALAVCDDTGKTVVAVGDVEQAVFPRSSVKAIQALPLVESGAADALGFGAADLALACASHAGEPEHATRAAGMLSVVGLDETALECGTHWPSRHEAALALAREGRVPSQLHNNCSGKHAGFICTCRHLGLDHRGYVDAGHRSQQMVREAMEAVTGARHGDENRAIDGCSIPTFAVPLKSLAHGFARMATGRGLGTVRAGAARRLLDACMAEPFLVAGTGKADTRMMQAAPGEIFVKVGAEGVYCAAVPRLGLGLAMKCSDGTERAAETMVAAALAALVGGETGERLDEMAHRPILSRKGVAVGSLRPAEALLFGR